MTIYLLDYDPIRCAQMLDDVSLDEQIKEIALILDELHYYLNEKKLHGHYCATFYNYINTFVLWANECKANYECLVDLLGVYLEEMLYRSEPEHSRTYYNKYQLIYEWARDNVPDLPIKKGIYLQKTVINNEIINKQLVEKEEGTEFPLAVPKKYTTYLNNKSEAIVFYGQVIPSRVITKLTITAAYRYYYKAKHKNKWTKRERPYWLEDNAT